MGTAAENNGVNMAKVHVVEEGSMFSGTRCVVGVFTTKKIAFKELRKCGYKYSKKEDTFYKDNFWAEVNPVEVNSLCGFLQKI